MEKLWGVWQLDEKLGQGSFGEVYKASKKELGQTFYAAIKHISLPKEQDDLEDIIREGYATTTEDIMAYYKDTIDDLVNETKIMYELRANKNIVDYQDHLIVEKEGKEVGFDIYIRMELLTSLDKYMKSHKLDETEIVKLFLDIATALKVCNKHNLLHRDIKPANIFIDDEGTYKLGDFGVARKLEKTTYGMSKKGTFNYMSPEIYKGEKANISSDIYSLGIVIYRLLNNNKAPFIDAKTGTVKASEAEQALMRRMAGEVLPDIEGVDPVLMKVIKKACAFYQKDRYKKPEDLITDLEKYQDGKTKELEDELDKTVSIYGDDELEKTVSIYGDDLLEKTVSIYGKQNGYESDEELRDRIKKIMSEEYNGVKGNPNFVTVKSRVEKASVPLMIVTFIVCIIAAVYSLKFLGTSRMMFTQTNIVAYRNIVGGALGIADLIVFFGFIVSLFSRRYQKIVSYFYLFNIVLLIGTIFYLRGRGVNLSVFYMPFIAFNMFLYMMNFRWRLGQRTIDIDKTQVDKQKAKDEKLVKLYSKPYMSIPRFIITLVVCIVVFGLCIGSSFIHVNQTNKVDPSKYQIKVVVDSINVRERPEPYASAISKVYKNDVYTVLGVHEYYGFKYYEIKTKQGVHGYIRSAEHCCYKEKNRGWTCDLKDIKDEYVVVISGGN